MLGKVFVLLLLVAVASAAQRVFLERERPVESPRGWEWAAKAEGSTMLRLTVALTQQNLKQLDRIFWAVSTPGNPQYGKHLNADEIADLIAPEQENIDTVITWLMTNGVKTYSLARTRDLISFEAPVSVVEKLLACEYHVFEHALANRRTVTSYGPYSVPSHIARIVDVVTGVTGFPALPNPKRSRGDRADPLIAPADLRNSYNVPSGAKGTQSSNMQAVAEFQAQFFSQTDLDTFFTQYVPYSSDSTVAKIVGSNIQTDPGVEASLDIQYIMGVAPSVPTWFWSNPGFNFWNDLINWMQQIFDTTNPPQVHSVSYGDQSVTGQPSDSLKNRLNTEFQKAGTMGLSIIFASGDSGAGCYLCSKIEPSFPATSPYVTGVGATDYISGVIGTTEGAVTAFGSGGGFSNTFGTASYQAADVNTYLNSGVTLPPATSFNATGRGTPDVAALGIGFQVVVNGKTDSVGGTSASAPTFAAIISLINDVLIADGKSTLGFLNPLLYANPSALTDVTVGNNKHLCCAGFQCTTGWDPVTGLGTPNYQKLLQVATAAKQ